jgi:hypothetical protein
MFNGCLGALPHCVPCCYHVKFWKGRGMGNFGRGRGGGWGMGWDGDGQVTKKKVFDPCLLLCSTRRSSQQKWSGGAGGGWRCLPGHPVYRCTHKQMYTQTNRWQKYLHTYMTCMYTYIHDVSSHVYKYRCFLLFQTDGSRITADSRPTSIYLSLVCFTFGSGGVEE